MEMREAQPYRVAVASLSGGEEYHSVIFAGQSPPKRLVCASCRTVSATEPRYVSGGGGVLTCRECAQKRRGRGGQGDVAEDDRSANDDGRLPPPQPFVHGDAELLKDSEVRFGMFGCTGFYAVLERAGNYSATLKHVNHETQAAKRVLCANAPIGCDFRGKLSILSSHLTFTCPLNIITCRKCGQRIVSRDFYRHVGTSDCNPNATAPKNMPEKGDPSLVWVPEFINWTRELVFPRRAQGLAVGTKPANHGAGPAVAVCSAATSNPLNWPGRACRKLKACVSALQSSLPPCDVQRGSSVLVGTLLVRFPDCVPLLGSDAGGPRQVDSPVHSHRVELFGSDQLVLDGFRLAICALLFYDTTEKVSCGLASMATALTRRVVFELLAMDVGDENASSHGRRRPSESMIVLTLNGFGGDMSLSLRACDIPGAVRWPESGGWARVAATEPVEAEVICRDFLAFGVVDMTVELH
ncbi:hypothetical protein HPB50_026084 [Hyalomma asiaticum]|uniref:Uncharacterized protein n=1 Tax=Hyalomma asiaticum TaxID=266040 RepID=A0ACB7RM58_HYAAI|nr:hypothetical protein HPB50_026084 [Hyalomma asiaticum]